MESILGKVGTILKLKISTRSNPANNRNFRARDIDGAVTVDQSNSNMSLNLPEEFIDRNRRRQAADEIWNALLELKNNIPAATLVMDFAHPNNELSQLRKDRNFNEATESLSEQSEICFQIERTAERQRPHVTTQVWTLFQAYFLVTIIPTLLLIRSDKSLKPNRWWESEGIKNALQSHEELAEIWQTIPSPEMPLLKCLEAIEEAIKREIQSEI